MQMLTVFTDFNEMTEDDVCWLLIYDHKDLGLQMESLGLSKGDKVILIQDEDNFEVTAALDFRYVEFLGRETWVALPDWSTKMIISPR
jgi:hypothetical protein